MPATPQAPSYEDDDIFAIIENAMAETARPDVSADELFSLVLNVGEGV